MTKTIFLNDFHISKNAKMVSFANFFMPLRYTSILEEHSYVRNKIGLFDVSHMGEFIVEDDAASDAIDYIMTRKIKGQKDYKVLYSLMCNEMGGTVDDVLVYKFSDTKFIIVVNASNIDKDRNWILKYLKNDIQLKDVSDEYCLFAIQGPLSEQLLMEMDYDIVKEMKYYTFIESKFQNNDIIISRTGYTGEDGFEILIKNENAIALIETIIKISGDNLKLCGLGCRDLCRIEAAYPLYGHELTDDLNALASQSKKVIDIEKKDFIGKLALTEPEYKIIGFKMTDKAIPREQYKIYEGNEQIGFVTSGIFSPLFNCGIGMGYIKSNFDKEEILIEIRNQKHLARITKLPFYSNVKK
ncbi:MAG: glycine cleavage system aminomethyltransferase GcvT [Candidatus Hydrogenedentota bacterium]